jgi:hypothetical protein
MNCQTVGHKRPCDEMDYSRATGADRSKRARRVSRACSFTEGMV